MHEHPRETVPQADCPAHPDVDISAAPDAPGLLAVQVLELAVFTVEQSSVWVVIKIAPRDFRRDRLNFAHAVPICLSNEPARPVTDGGHVRIGLAHRLKHHAH